MSESSQTCFDTSNDRRESLKGALNSGSIGDDRSIWTSAGMTPWSVGIVVANLLGRSVMVDHRIHGTGRDSGEQPRTAHDLEGFRISPVRLSEDTNPKAFGFEQAGQKWCTESRMVDIGISRNEEHIEFVPAALFHFSPATGNESVGCFCQLLSYFRCALLMTS